jgi:hypothetical protein
MVSIRPKQGIDTDAREGEGPGVGLEEFDRILAISRLTPILVYIIYIIGRCENMGISMMIPPFDSRIPPP